MNRRPTALLLTLALLGAPALAQSGSAPSGAVTSLSAAVSAALANNSDVRTAQANLDKALAANAATQADPSALAVPKLSARNGAALAAAALRAAKLGALQNTITAYTGLLEAQENVEVQTLQVQVDTKGVQVAQIRQGVGNATALDVANARNTLAASTQNLADARAQVGLSATRLSTLTGLGAVRAAGPIRVPRLNVTLAGLQGGLDKLSTLVSAQNDLALAQLNVRLADNDFTPARTLQDARTAQANAARALDSAQKSAAQNLSSAYQSAQNAYELLGVAQNREAAAQKTYTQDAARLRSGTISAVDLQNTQLNLKKAQFARLQAQDNALRALAALSAAAGVNLTGVGGTI